ncbi:hypothetical protein Cgig2_033591 [Carnegiea gigantea]|uniref:Uncharacterized protein n=1 Tax=Carnegiea gigantea TaxID=171969 RepID=A0A9Q1KPH1_9CARY|nr:hypothetical protein Cgig2_033591 [Carnegiea gigantea]
MTIVEQRRSKLHNFDVHSLCQPQIAEVDVFDSDVEKNLGQADDEESDHDDSEDSYFREWKLDGSKESESFLLDKDDDLELENESLDDIDLETDTQLHMTLGYGSIDDDVGENLLIVNKMAKRGRPEKHKRRKSRLPFSPQMSSIQLSGTKRCKKCKQLGHNSLTCGQPRDENRRLKYKKKPR